MNLVPYAGWLGLLLILFGLGALLPFFNLSRIYDYPAILRRPTEEVLTRYQAGGRALRLSWLLFALSFVLLIPITTLLADALARQGAELPYLSTATAFGLIAAVLNLAGLIRWSVLVPHLAALYTAPDATPATRDALAVVFRAFHVYLGETLGEILGYAFLSTWGILIGAALLQTGLLAPAFGIGFIALSAALLVGELEFLGWRPAGLITALASTLLMLLVIATGIAFLGSGF